MEKRKIEVKNENLFNITVKGKWRDLDIHVNADTLAYYAEYYTTGPYADIVTVKGVSKTTLHEDIELYAVEYNKSNCYREEIYELRSKQALSETDFEHLRALKSFMGGQECGKVVSHKLEGGVHVYKLRSVCDSSD